LTSPSPSCIRTGRWSASLVVLLPHTLLRPPCFPTFTDFTGSCPPFLSSSGRPLFVRRFYLHFPPFLLTLGRSRTSVVVDSRRRGKAVPRRPSYDHCALPFSFSCVVAVVVYSFSSFLLTSSYSYFAQYVSNIGAEHQILFIVGSVLTAVFCAFPPPSSTFLSFFPF
jgi:hypothetical protein